jgi:hypothetical protein
MEARLQSEEDADALAQAVVNAWGENVKAGNGELLSTELKTCACRDAKRNTDNHREFNWLTAEDTFREQVTRREFWESYRRFQGSHADHTEGD